MRTVSDTWRALIDSEGAWMECKAVIGGTEYPGASIVSMRVYGGLFEEFGIGNAAARQLDLEILPIGDIPRQARIEVFARLTDGASSGEWLPNGVFFISTRKTDRSSGVMSIHGYDAMLKGDEEWWTNDYAAASWPMPVAAAVADIAARMGVQLDGRTSLAPGSVPFPAPGGEREDGAMWTMRETLGYIAAANAGNWTITEDGKLLLVPAAGRSDAVSVGNRVETLEPGEETTAVSGVVLLDEAGAVLGSAGDRSGKCIEAVQPWGDNAMAAAVLSSLSGYVYRPYSGVNALLDPAAELGDTVTVGGITSLLTSKDTTFGPAYLSDISAPANDELEDEYPYKSKSQRESRRQTALTRSLITKTADEINLRIDGVDGELSEISQTVDSIRFTVSDPTSGPSGSYVTLTLTVGGNTYRGVVMIDGNVDISGSISASELYAMYGSVANLEVNRLSTSRRIPKYLSGDTSDDQYIRVEGQHIYFIQGTVANSTEQALDPNGAALYWEQDVTDATIGTDGYPYVGGQRVFTTTSPTSWPVMVYTYDESVKLRLEYDDSSEYHEPRLVFGAGWGESDADIGRGFLQKAGNEFKMWYHGPDGGDRGLFIGDTHTHIVGLPRTSSMDFSAWDSGSFSEALDDDTEVAYTVEFDASGNPVKISDGNGHETSITW